MMQPSSQTGNHNLTNLISTNRYRLSMTIKKVALAVVVLGLLCSCSDDRDHAALENPVLAKELASSDHPGQLFLQMADTQFGFFDKPLALTLLNIPWNDDSFAEETANFELAIDYANNTKAEFVVMCGDLVNVPDHPKQHAEFKRISGLLDSGIPLYLVSGNHDVTNTPTTQSLANYRNRHGKDWYSFTAGEILGIVINSTLINDNSQAPEEEKAQRQWLEQTLIAAQKKQAKHIIVFQHHPYFTDTADEENSMANIDKPLRQIYLDLLAAYDVEAVFSGHAHQNFEHDYQGMAMITTGAIGRPMAGSRSGFRVVRSLPSTLSHAFIALQDL